MITRLFIDSLLFTELRIRHNQKETIKELKLGDKLHLKYKFYSILIFEDINIRARVYRSFFCFD